MPKHSLFLLVALLTAFNGAALGAAKKQQSPCSQPPQLVSKRPLPKEEQEKAKRIRAQETVAIVISEEGDVVDARVERATSQEAGRLLIDVAKGMKFKPRPACGSFKTSVSFNLAE
jgi:TonB family protein